MSEAGSPRPDAGTLARHRAAIESLDVRILELVARRQGEARAIGELKRLRGTPLRNYEVEAQVCARLEAEALVRGLDGALGRDLALFLIERSLETQAPLVETAYAGDRLRALVVGGAGGMGRWIAGFLESQGHAVRIFDPAPGESRWPRADDLAGGLAWAELVVVSVPMSTCAEVLEDIAACGARGAVVEICSLKGHLLPTLERVRARGLRLVSLHPMFGPDVRLLSGRNIVLCTEGREEDRGLVRGLFTATSANLVEMSVAEHDRLMAGVLGLSHLSSLVFARALAHSGHPPADLESASGVTFRKQAATARDVAGENPALYYEIQALNAATPEAFSWMERALTDYRQAVDARDPSAFVALMRQSAQYFERGRPVVGQ